MAGRIGFCGVSLIFCRVNIYTKRLFNTTISKKGELELGLEKEAKTLQALLAEYVVSTKFEVSEAALDENNKWVRLVDHQKIIQSHEEVLDKCIQSHSELELKVGTLEQEIQKLNKRNIENFEEFNAVRKRLEAQLKRIRSLVNQMFIADDGCEECMDFLKLIDELRMEAQE